MNGAVAFHVMSLFIENFHIREQVKVNGTIGGFRLHGSRPGDAPIVSEISREVLRIAKDCSSPGVSVSRHIGKGVVVDGNWVAVFVENDRCVRLLGFRGCGARYRDGATFVRGVVGWSCDKSVGCLDAGYCHDRDGSVSRQRVVVWRAGRLSRAARV